MLVVKPFCGAACRLSAETGASRQAREIILSVGRTAVRSFGIVSILCLWTGTWTSADVFESEQQLAAVREQLAAEYHTAPLPLTWYFKTDPEDRGVQERWFNVTPRDTPWAKIRTDERWENQGCEGYDGLAWYMCRVHMPSDWTRFFIRFPAVDDAYILYVNGREVCRDGDRFRSLWRWSTSHEVTDFVQAGKEASIVLRVEDYGGFGGLVGGPGELLDFPAQIDVSMGWRFCTDDLNVGVARGWFDTQFDDSAWRLMDAGRNWESYGYDFDGFGRYRKWVTVPPAWADQRIFLELPAVDDFFDLYIDGRFIHHFGTPGDPCWGKITRVDVTACMTSGCRHLVCLRVEDTGMPGGLCGAPCTLSAQMPIYWLAKDRDYAYLYKDRPEGAPHIGPWPRETAIEGQSFRGMPPELLHGENVSWSLARGPLGLRIDPNTGTISWDEPTTGPEAFLDQDRRWDHPVTVKAQNEFGYDYATFQLKTLDNKGPALQRIRTQYIDWIVTEPIAAWFEATRPQEVIDRQCELMRDVIGHEPSYGRQSVKYQYNIDGRAWSGSPTIVGPGLWSTDPVDGWSPGIWLHEVGHNFNWQTPLDKVVFGPLDGWYHHFVEVLIQYVLHYSIEHPGQFALSGEKLATYQQHLSRVRAHAYDQYHNFQTWVKDNDNAADFPGDQYAAWKGLLIELIDTFGCQTLERCIRAMRTDGVPRSLRESADTVERKNALVFCILSHAAGTDLRDLFRRNKLRFDEGCYSQIDSQVAEITSHLPDEDLRGWKRHPTTGHYYRRTPFEMTWCEAEDYAQSVGGHLACVEGEAELSWLCSRFEIYGQAWIGLYRNEGGAWGRFTRGRPWQPTWHDGYPVPAQDHCFAALDLVGCRIRNRSDLDTLFGIVEVEELPRIDDPGFTVTY